MPPPRHDPAETAETRTARERFRRAPRADPDDAAPLTAANSANEAEVEVEARQKLSIAFSIHICAIVLAVGALFFAREFLLPVVLALLFSLILVPIVRWLSRRGVPPAATAPLLVIAIALGFGTGVYALSGPLTDWIDRAPMIGTEIERKLGEVRGSVEAVARATQKVDELTKGAEDPAVQEVVVREPGFMTTATTTLWSAVTTLGIALLLTMFILASGDMLYEKIIRVMPTLSDKKTALRIVTSVETSISRYLLTVTLINICLGVAVGTAMWAIGMPNPPLWGVAATLLNFLPYIGAITGAVLVSAVAFLSFDTLGYALLAPVVYLTLTTLEGNVVTPLVLGRRLEINTVAIFVAVAFWGWIWGLVGVFIAVPILVVIKRLSEHLPSWSGFGEFLAIPQGSESPKEETKPEPGPSVKI